MKLKKVIALLLAVVVVASCAVALVACNDKTEDFKIGLICLHDTNSTYDKNFIDAFVAAYKALGIEDDNVYIATGIPEGDECYQKACELADMGCKVIFADSFGHEDYMIKAAKKYPNVQFCHATGTKAHTENLDNYANAFAAIYEGRYLAGIAAGMKLNEMKAANQLKNPAAPKMGYVGAWTYAEVISGYTSFYLGAKSVCPEVVMDVKFTGSWYDQTKEAEVAAELINGGCDLISQHADSMGAPNTCQEARVPNVSYNGSTISACPDTFIVSSRINWKPYYEYVVNQVREGKKVATDWTGTIATGSVELTEINTAVAAAGTADAIATAKAQLQAGTLKVFNTDTFTVSTKIIDPENGVFVNANSTVDANKKLISYMADVDTDPNYTGDTEVVMNGYFSESSKRSAPYFDLTIDGITLLNTIM